jgi:hypothetical protein
MTTGGHGDARPPRRAMWIGALLVGTLALLVHAASFGFEVDDAYISFRYAQNLVEGHGLVFNPGESVEGYTNFAWVLLSALGISLGIDPLLFARLLGALATIGVLALSIPAVTRLDARTQSFAPAAPLLLAACGPLACWTFAGLETPLVALLALAAWLAALSARPLPAAGAALALGLTRPDGIALGGMFLLWAIVAGARGGGARGRLSAIVGALLFAAGIGAHVLWRHATYDAWLPNTFYAKTGDLWGQLHNGVPYALDFLRAFVAPWIGVGLWSAAATGNRFPSDARVRATLGVLLVWLVYVVAVGGDGLGMFRFFVPILPILVVTGVVALARALDATVGSPTRGHHIAATAALAGAMLISSFTGTERSLVTAHMSDRNLGGWKRAGDTLAHVLPEGTTIALAPVGYIPYRTGLVTYDILGLTDPVIARREMDFEIGYAGHEKHDGARILSRRPDYMLLGNVDVTEEPRRGLIPPFRPELDIYRDPAFQRDYVSVSIPLDDGGYLNCFRRRELGEPERR